MREEKSEAHKRNMEAFQNMIENSRREKRERDSMRMEDKYTDETDPVESLERRNARLRKEWEEANPELLKDDMKEMAEKKLAQEKEGERRAGKATKDKSEDAAASSLDSLDGVSGTGIVEVDEVPEVKKKDGKVDNRKLVYEDIWDDSPSPWQRTIPNPELPTTPQLGEEFVPWAAPKNEEPEKPQDLTEEEITRRAIQRKKELQGQAANKGMDKPGGFLDQRAQELADEEEKVMREIAGDDSFKPSWYSRQQEKINETMRKLQGGGQEPQMTEFKWPSKAPVESDEKKEPAKKQHVFAPPARGKAASAAPPPPPQNELDEMD